MKPRNRQIIFETISYSLAAILLIIAQFMQSISFVIYLLWIEWGWGIIMTVGWWKWLDGVDLTKRVERLERLAKSSSELEGVS